MCQRLEMLGVQHPGGYAEYVVVPEHVEGDVFTRSLDAVATAGRSWSAVITPAWSCRST